MTFDIIIHSGSTYDGISDDPVAVDIGIMGDRITAIGDLSEAQAQRRIDASGLVVAPGFIDIHGHSDLSCLAGPLCESKVHQGVTTELCGACGYSPAPVTPATRADMEAGQFFVGATVEWDWLTFDEYLATVERTAPSMNTVHLVGHTPLRMDTVGGDARAATEDELERMARSLEEALEQGGAGFSSGLIYPPGSFADTQELAHLSAVAARQGKGYYTHIRDEGARLLEAVDEAIRIGRESGAPVEIAHHKAGGRSNWGKVHESLAMIEAAQAEGVDVRVDVYPYLAGSTTLTAQLPQFAHEGGRAAMLRRLADPVERARITEALGGEKSLGEGGDDHWASVMVAGVSGESDRVIEGMTLREIADAQGKPPIEMMLDLLLAHEGRISSVNFMMCEEDMEFVVQHPLAVIGSDASAVSAHNGVRFGKPHPRAYGTFARVLGQLSRDRAVLPLHDALRKMTSEPARRLGITDRGTLRQGGFADITVFDPTTIGDTATYKDPHCFPAGISFVIVNGAVVIDEGTHTGARAGRVLRL